jgi:hypothetical protein
VGCSRSCSRLCRAGARHALTRDTWVRFGGRFRSKFSNHWHRLVGPVPNPRKVSPSRTECGEFRAGQRPNFCHSKRSMRYIGNRTFAPIPACPSSGHGQAMCCASVQVAPAGPAPACTSMYGGTTCMPCVAVCLLLPTNIQTFIHTRHRSHTNTKLDLFHCTAKYKGGLVDQVDCEVGVHWQCISCRLWQCLPGCGGGRSVFGHSLIRPVGFELGANNPTSWGLL